MPEKLVVRADVLCVAAPVLLSGYAANVLTMRGWYAGESVLRQFLRGVASLVSGAWVVDMDVDMDTHYLSGPQIFWTTRRRLRRR